MVYKEDSSKNKYLEIPLGWDSPKAQLRITYVSKNNTVRLNKSDEENHIYPGPEFDYESIPKLIEVLAKISNDKNNATIPYKINC
tara:strand:+ start:1070 stop:1324 length:255 start_codon:yes stop_codon:yes gene_type:complete